MTSRGRRSTWHAKLLAAWLLVPAPLFAQSALIFERANIRIESPAPNVADENVKQPAKQPVPHEPAKFNVEVRGEEALRLEYIHTLNTLDDDSGVLITFANPALVSLPAMKVYTPVDVLFIAEDGELLLILPAVTLGEITQNLGAKAPVKAILFLKKGEALARGLHPHDQVIGSMFQTPQAVQK